MFMIEDARLMDYAQVTVKACESVSLLVLKSLVFKRYYIKIIVDFKRLILPSSFCVVISKDGLLE